MIAGEEDIMKKAIIGIVLLMALVAISYVKIHRDRQHVIESRQEGVIQGQADLSARTQQLDSVSAVVEQHGQAMAESLASWETQQAVATDSLRSTIDEQCDVIDSLKRQVQKSRSTPAKKTATTAGKKAATAPKTATTANKTTPDSGSDSTAKAAQKDILAYYKQQIDKLPGDLSDYERRVALREVREETAEKYAITVKRLNEIREQYSLDY
jgi:hypothetical protein